MTANTFRTICEMHGISPFHVIDHPKVKELLARDKGKCSIVNEMNLNAILTREF